MRRLLGLAVNGLSIGILYAILAVGVTIAVLTIALLFPFFIVGLALHVMGLVLLNAPPGPELSSILSKLKQGPSRVQGKTARAILDYERKR